MSTSETTLDNVDNNFHLTSESESFFKRIQPWLVCLTASLFFFYEFIQMTKFNVISQSLLTSFHLDPVGLGYLSSTYLAGDVLMLMFSGLIIDRFSTRKLILGAMLISSISTLGFALTSSAKIAGLFHLLEGASSAFCLISNVVLASRWFPPRRQALVVGIIVTMAMFGGWAAQTPLEELSAAFGWRHTLLFDAVLGFGIFGLIWLFVQDYPEGKGKTKVATQQKQNYSVGKSIKLAMSNSQNWLCGIYTSLLNLPLMVLGAVWGDMYLSQVQGINNHDASVIVSMLFWGTIVGSPISGWLSDTMARRKLPMIIGAILSLVVLLTIMYSPHLSYYSLIALFFALGLFSSTQIITYPTVKESNDTIIGATALSIASVLIMGGAAISQPLYAAILAYGGHGTIVNNALVYPPEAFLKAMWMMAGAFVLCIVAAFAVRETYCKAQVE